MCRPPPLVMVSAMTLSEIVMSLPPYVTMLFARIGRMTVLNVNLLFTFGMFSAHMARPSSPLLRTKVLVTVELVTP